jgi:hypothetical protein
MRLLKEITLVDPNQGNYFENATACSKRMRKTLVATQLNRKVKVERQAKVVFFAGKQI